MILILKKILNERASRKTYHMSPVQFALQLIQPDYLTECITNWATNSSCTHRITNALHSRTHLLGHLLTPPLPLPPPLVPRNGSLKDGIRTLAINTIGRGRGEWPKNITDVFLETRSYQWTRAGERYAWSLALPDLRYTFPKCLTSSHGKGNARSAALIIRACLQANFELSWAAFWTTVACNLIPRSFHCS